MILYDKSLYNYDSKHRHLVSDAHLSGNTSGVLKSSSDWLNYAGFPGDVCVTFFNVPPGNKDALVKEESRRVYKCDANAYQSRLNAGFQKYVKYLKNL